MLLSSSKAKNLPSGEKARAEHFWSQASRVRPVSTSHTRQLEKLAAAMVLPSGETARCQTPSSPGSVNAGDGELRVASAVTRTDTAVTDSAVIPQIFIFAQNIALIARSARAVTCTAAPLPVIAAWMAATCAACKGAAPA